MKKPLVSASTAFAMACLVVACSPWGTFDNKGDPKAANYQGYPTVGDVDDLKPVSPLAGLSAVFAPKLVALKVAGADSYHFQIASSSTFAASVLVHEDDTVASNEYVPIGWSNLDLLTTYYWRGRAHKGGAWGSWSTELATFSLAAPNAGTTVPASGATVSTAMPSLDWGDIAGASSYRIQISTSSAFSTTVTDDSTLSTSAYAQSTILADSTTYYWRVAARSADGVWSAFCSAASFTAAYTTAAAPTFSTPGGAYATDQTVTLTTTTANAAIYYTMDSVTPTTSSTPYTGAISVTGNGTVKTIKAIAISSISSASTIASATYTIAYPPAATPTFSPAGGNYTTDQSVTISCTTANATIYYTTDGTTTPTTSSTQYAGAIAVSGNGTVKTIKAIAISSVTSTSAVVSATYTIAYSVAATPTFSPAGGNCTTDQSVTIGCTTANPTIYYTTDGTTPTTSSTLYAGAIIATVNPVMTIKAIASAAGYLQSAVATATYFKSSLSMITVPGGIFNNGTSDVTVSGFLLSQYEITQAQYTTITGNSPSSFTGDTSRPVEQVTWYDAVEFCNKLSTADGLQSVYAISGRTPSPGYPITSATVSADWTKNGYRLPTEAEWEYAARGGGSTHGYGYSGSNDWNAVAWCRSNSGSTTHAVGSKAANELGAYDMSGNVWEWCWDWFGSYPSGAQTNPSGAASGTQRVLRGGSWFEVVEESNVACRYSFHTYDWASAVGFRVARSQF
jgi:formylglycine-generating enzyme required for sulfatase activity